MLPERFISLILFHTWDLSCYTTEMCVVIFVGDSRYCVCTLQLQLKAKDTILSWVGETALKFLKASLGRQVSIVFLHFFPIPYKSAKCMAGNPAPQSSPCFGEKGRVPDSCSLRYRSHLDSILNHQYELKVSRRGKGRARNKDGYMYM